MASLDTLSGLWSVSGEDDSVCGAKISWPTYRERRGSLERLDFKPLRRFSEDNDLRDVRFLSYDGISKTYEKDRTPSSSEPSDTESCGQPAYKGDSMNFVSKKCEKRGFENSYSCPKSEPQIYDSDDSGTASKVMNFREKKEMPAREFQPNTRYLQSWNHTGDSTYKSVGESTRLTFQKGKKSAVYDSDDSGTVCGEESTSSASSNAEEPVDKFEQRFGHLFKHRQLPPPLPYTKSLFNSMPERCSKRRAPLPPLPPQAQKSEELHQQRSAETHRNLQRCRSSNILQSSTEGSGISTNTVSVSFRKSLKRRLSLAGLFQPSRPDYSRVPEYFTQTAPSTMLPPSKMPSLDSQEIYSLSNPPRCTSYTGRFCASSTTSSESVNGFSSFNSTSSLGENSMVTVVPQTQFTGDPGSRSSYSDFSSTGSSSFSTSSWGTSSFSSLQRLGNHELVEVDESRFKSVPPHIIACQSSTQYPALGQKDGGEWRTPKLATILPSGHRGAMKSLRETNTCVNDSSNISDGLFRFNRGRSSSSEGCDIDDDSLINKKLNADQHKRFKSLSRRQRLRRSLKKVNSASNNKMDFSTLPGPTRKKTLRQWFSSVTSKREDLANGENNVWIGQYSKSNSDSEVSEDTPSCWNPQFKDGLAKSRSETALNQMLDQVDVQTLVTNQTPEPPPKLEQSRWSRSLTELRLFARVGTVTADSSVDISRVDDEDLKHTRIVVLPHDTNLTEPPIYENVTCVIKPKPPSKPSVTALHKSLPTCHVPKPMMGNLVGNQTCGTTGEGEEKGDSIRTSERNITKAGNLYQNCTAAKSAVYSCDSGNVQQVRTKSLPDICIPDGSTVQKSMDDSDSLNSSNDETEIPAHSTDTKEKSPVLEELRISKRFSRLQSSLCSQPSSPLVTKKSVTPRHTGTVKELIQRFSSMDNLSQMNNTLPCRSPNRKFIKGKSKVRAMVSNDFTSSTQKEDGTQKYNTWGRCLTKEQKQPMSPTYENPRSSEISVLKSPDSTNITIISIPESKSSLISDHNKLIDEKSSIEKRLENHLLEEPGEDDSPFTEMIKNSRVFKTVQNRLPEDDSNAKETSSSVADKSVGQGNSDIQMRNYKVDLITLRETRRRRLSLNNSLCTSTLPTHEEEATFLESGTKSMNFLTELRYSVEKEENICSNSDVFEDETVSGPNTEDVTFTNVKRSPFQKFKDSLYNSFHSHDSKTKSTSSNVHSDLFNNRKAESNCTKSSKRQAYIQLKSLRTWKDVTKSSKNKQGSSTNESDSTASNTLGSYKPSSNSSSPMSSRYNWSKTSDGVSDFSSYNSSLRSNRSLAPEFYAQAPIDENWSNVRTQRSFSTGASRDSWKFDPICNDESCPPFGSLESSNSIHDRDRSITYSSHQANGIYQGSGTNNYATVCPPSRYTKMFKHPNRYFNPPSFTYNLNLTTPQADTDAGTYNQRRHSLSDFSPEISNNVGKLSKKLTPSNLYPLTLSPTNASRDQTDWATRRRQLPPPPTFKPGLTSDVLEYLPPLKTSPSLPLPAGPGDFSLPLRHTTSLGYPPYFCTKDMKSSQDVPEKYSREMPPPMKYSGMNKSRSSQHRSLLQSEK